MTWLLQRNMALHGRRIYYADDHTPITGFKFFLNFMNEIFYGVLCVRCVSAQVAADASCMLQATTSRARTTGAAARSAFTLATQARAHGCAHAAL